MLDPDKITDADLRLHMGEMTAQECRTARAAIRWANSVMLARCEKAEAERDAALAKLGEISSIIAIYVQAEEAAQHEACPWPSAKDAVYEVAAALASTPEIVAVVDSEPIHRGDAHQINVVDDLPFRAIIVRRSESDES